MEINEENWNPVLGYFIKRDKLYSLYYDGTWEDWPLSVTNNQPEPTSEEDK